jgi:hypothetical protein
MAGAGKILTVMRYTFAIAISLLMSLGACSRDKSAAITYKHLRQIGGDSAIDCGYVRFGESDTRTNECVINAYHSHNPFIARYDVKGMDARLVFGLAGDATGRVVSVKYDSEGYGRPEREGASLTEGSHVLLTPCPTPIEFFSKQAGYLSCYED